MPEFNEQIDISEHRDNPQWVSKQIQLLFQRGLNFASHYGNGRAVEIVKVDKDSTKASLHLRVTDTVLVTGD